MINIEMLKVKNMINIIYQAQEEEIDKILKETDKKLKDKIDKIETEKIIEDSSYSKELRDIFSKIEDNYNIKITEYNKEMYKQGFVDGVNLILNCLKDLN